MAVKCPKCRTENLETSLFCAGGGAKLNAVRGEERFKKLMERAKYEWGHFEE